MIRMKKNVLNIRSLGVAFSLMVCFSACSNVENIEQNDGQPVEIKLSSGVTPESRALTPTQSTQIESGETVYVWAEKNSDKSSYIDAWSLTADGEGNLTPAVKKYFPTDKASLDIYALHGNFTVSDEMPASISVLEDQSTKEAYCESDLLYAVSTNVPYSEEIITLDFKHQLSKIEINLIAGSGIVFDQETSIKILNTKLKADVTFNKDVDATASVVLSFDNNNATDITPFQSSDVEGVYAEAIVIPQEVSGTFVEVTVGGTPYYYTIPTQTLKSGYKYILNLTVGESASATPAELSWTE